ncbi:hypothetical protein ACN20G_20095 [Streptomyces sp. BI20]|uniref:hypothetical protein n=1 Tax=Streptomyces sp. BI20 TaxID=3403460 RepID=UPI003C7608F2
MSKASTTRIGRLLGAAGPAPGPRGAKATGNPARMPFVLLVVALLGGGLIGLLLLNSALNQGSFEVSRLKKEAGALQDETQELQRDVDAHAAPDALARRARELGLVPGGSPVFLAADGKVLGTPTPAAAPPPPPTPTPAAPTGAAPAPTGSEPPATAAPSPLASPAGEPEQSAPPGAGPSGEPAGPPAASPSTGR